MKAPQRHALNIVTLAIWLSVSGLAGIVICVPSARHMVSAESPAENSPDGGGFFTVGGVSAAGSGAGDADDAAEEPTPVPLPAPPLLASRAPLADLPEVPRPTARASRMDPGNVVAARLAAGHTPGPSYPAGALSTGQSGTVVVQFTVDAAGNVRAVKIYTSSNWPLLDREALRTVESWKFPPGDTLSLIRPIVFRLP